MLSVSLFGAGCKQSNGDRCEVNRDCESNNCISCNSEQQNKYCSDPLNPVCPDIGGTGGASGATGGASGQGGASGEGGATGQGGASGAMSDASTDAAGDGASDVSTD